MKSGAMALGIIGGVFAFLVGLLGFTLGQVGNALGGSAGGFMFLALALPMVGLLGGALAKAKPEIAAGMMLSSAVGVVWVFGIHLLSLLGAIPLCLGGILAIVGRHEDAVATHSVAHPA